jgi:hypothetical protein
LLSKPTTLSGYGITDAYPLSGNPSGFITGINSAAVTTALGFTPVNPDGLNSQYIAGDGTKIAFPAEAGVNSQAGYGTGTAYSLTTTSAKVTMGTSSPEVTLPTAGTYMIISNLNLQYAGLTTVGAATANVKLRRTNNTAGDLTNATADFEGQIATLLTGPAGDIDIKGVLYTTSTAGDVIEMWGSRGNNITLGALNVSQAWIIAVRIY